MRVPLGVRAGRRGTVLLACTSPGRGRWVPAVAAAAASRRWRRRNGAATSLTESAGRNGLGCLAPLERLLPRSRGRRRRRRRQSYRFRYPRGAEGRSWCSGKDPAVDGSTGGSRHFSASSVRGWSLPVWGEEARAAAIQAFWRSGRPCSTDAERYMWGIVAGEKTHAGTHVDRFAPSAIVR